MAFTAPSAGATRVTSRLPTTALLFAGGLAVAVSLGIALIPGPEVDGVQTFPAVADSQAWFMISLAVFLGGLMIGAAFGSDLSKPHRGPAVGVAILLLFSVLFAVSLAYSVPVTLGAITYSVVPFPQTIAVFELGVVILVFSLLFQRLARIELERSTRVVPPPP